MRLIYFLLVFRLLGIAQAQEPSVLIQNLKSGNPQTLVFYGTSLTRGSWTTQTERALKKRYGNLISVQNCAKSGEDSNWGLTNMTMRVLPSNPDTITIEFSMNDAAKARNISVDLARQNLLKMIALLKEHNPQVEIILLTMNPVGGEPATRTPEHPYYRDLPAYYQMVRDVSATQGFRLIDLHAVWKEWRDESPGEFAVRVPDGVHPDATGCRDIILPAVLDGLGFSAEE